MSKDKCFCLILFIGGCVTLFIGLILNFALLDQILGVDQNILLVNDSYMFKAWSRPRKFYITVFLFNITNPEEVILGEKPNLEEVGPYIYDCQLIRDNITIKDDQITFHERFVSAFDADANPGLYLSAEDIVTVPDVLLLDVLRQADDFPLLKDTIVKIAYKFFPGKKSPFLQIPVRQLLYQGFDVNCRGQSGLVGSICKDFLTKLRNYMWLTEDGSFKFSFLRWYNSSLPHNTYTVLSGEKNIQDVGKIVAYEQSDSIFKTQGPYCTKINATTDCILPPRVTKNSIVRYFEPLFCRSIQLLYSRRSKYREVDTLFFEVTYDTFESGLSNPDNLCYCQKTDEGRTCPPNGTFDLYNCLGAHILVSWPLFIYGDKNLSLNAFGNSFEIYSYKHRTTYLEVEPVTGIPLRGAKRIQLNVEMKPNGYFPFMENLTQTITPIFWMDEMFEVEEDDFVYLQKQLHRKYIAEVVIYIAIAAGALMIVISIGGWWAKQRTNSERKIHSISSSNTIQAYNKESDTMNINSLDSTTNSEPTK